jgi:hypothetical protein
VTKILGDVKQQHGLTLLFPTVHDPGKILPKDWIVVHATKANGNILKRMYDEHESFNLNDRRVFNRDVLQDMSESVGRRLVKVCILVQLDFLRVSS